MADSKGSALAVKLALAAWGAFLLLATLAPAASDPQLPDFWCLPCGSRGTADALLNLVFFIPGGALAAHLFGTPRTVVVMALGVLAIEGLQLFIPGRHPSLSDIVFDTAGAWVGAGLLTPRGFRAGARVAGVVGATAWLATPLLLTPLAPPDTLWGQWTAEFEGMARYEGQVIEARVGANEVDSWRFPGSALSQALAEREDVRVRFEAGPPPQGLAPIFSIADRHGTHSLFIGADGGDVFVRVRALAARLRLEQPGWWAPDGLEGVDVGETVSLEVAWQGPETCIEVHGVTTCGVTPGPDEGWRFLIASARPPGIPVRLASLLWCALVGASIGVSARGPVRALGLALAVVGVAAGLCLLSPDAQPAPAGSVLVVVGSLAGARLARGLWRWAGDASRP